MMYELYYMNALRDCGYSHEANDLAELRAEIETLREEDSAMANYFEGYWADIELFDESGKLIERHELRHGEWEIWW